MKKHPRFVTSRKITKICENVIFMLKKSCVGTCVQNLRSKQNWQNFPKTSYSIRIKLGLEVPHAMRTE